MPDHEQPFAQPPRNAGRLRRKVLQGWSELKYGTKGTFAEPQTFATLLHTCHETYGRKAGWWLKHRSAADLDRWRNPLLIRQQILK